MTCSWAAGTVAHVGPTPDVAYEAASKHRYTIEQFYVWRLRVCCRLMSGLECTMESVLESLRRPFCESLTLSQVRIMGP